MRPAVERLVPDVEAFLAEAVREERAALTGEANWLALLPALLERWGIADAYDAVVATWLSIEPLPATRDLLGVVRAHGVPCYLASNQARQRAEVMRDELGYGDLVDEMFLSYELGVAKPDPAYFQRILDTLGTPAGDLLFLDDSAANVESARTLGLRAEVWSYHEDLEVLRGHLTRHGVRL